MNDERMIDQDAMVRARRSEAATIELSRIGGRVQLRLVSPTLVSYLQTLMAQARPGYVPGESWPGSPVEEGPWKDARMLSLPTTNLQMACGTASYTADDGTFYALVPRVDYGYALKRGDQHQVSIVPFFSEQVLLGEPLTVHTMLTRRQMTLLVKGWRMFLENIHKDHAQDIIVGARLITEEYYVPPALKAVMDREAVRAVGPVTEVPDAVPA